MSETTAAALPAAPQKLELPAMTQDLTKVQLGWIKLANKKEQTFAELQKFELNVQGILNGLDTTADPKELSTVQESLKAAKAKFAELKDCRLQLTRLVEERLFVPAMEFEKRSEELIKKVAANELVLRKAAVAIAEAVGLVDSEIQKFIAHVKNENFRIAADYRVQLVTFINNQYVGALEQSVPAADVEQLKADIKEGLKLAELSKFEKYNPSERLTEEQLKTFKERQLAEYAKIPKLDKAGILADAEKTVDEKFIMYAQDLAQAAKAVEASKKESAEIVESIKEEAVTNTAINNLTSQAAPLVMAGTAAIKKSFAVEDENSFEWAVAVTTNFLRFKASVLSLLRTKSWEKLTVGQMAAALGKLYTENPNIALDGLKVKEVEK